MHRSADGESRMNWDDGAIALGYLRGICGTRIAGTGAPKLAGGRRCQPSASAWAADGCRLEKFGAWIDDLPIKFPSA